MPSALSNRRVWIICFNTCVSTCWQSTFAFVDKFGYPLIFSHTLAVSIALVINFELNAIKTQHIETTLESCNISGFVKLVLSDLLGKVLSVGLIRIFKLTLVCSYNGDNRWGSRFGVDSLLFVFSWIEKDVNKRKHFWIQASCRRSSCSLKKVSICVLRLGSHF